MRNKVLVFLLLVAVVVIAILYSRQANTSNPIQSILNPTDSNPKVDAIQNNTLDLSNQGLDKLPSDVLNNSSLEELNISNNRLTGALPSEIRRLTKLRVLNASNNLMTGVPAEIGQLQNLEILDLSNNELTGLPNELGNLKKLKTLNLSGNDYSKQDLEVIKKGLSPTVEIIGL